MNDDNWSLRNASVATTDQTIRAEIGCPACGADPGEECEMIDQRRVGDGRIHGERFAKAAEERSP